MTPNLPFQPEHLLTTEEVLRWLRISRTTLYRWIHNQSFPNYGYGSGRCLRFRMSEIQRWMSDQRISSTPLTDIAG